jgi:hypothetical protein
MKTYGTSFNIRLNEAKEMKQSEGSITIGLPFGRGEYEEPTSFLETKRGALLAIVGTIWDFHPSNVREYIVKRVKKD